jgi:deoxyribonuclease V
VSLKSSRPIKEFIELQRNLAEKLNLASLQRKVETIAGADVSANLYSNTLYAGIVVLKFPELEVVETATHKFETSIPYIPGLLSFRELPALLECIKKLSHKPSVFMVDGQGVAHPRRLGIAAHLGVVTNTSSIGVAKSVLYGKVAGDELLDPKSGEKIGRVLRTKKGSNPLIISPGHLITLEESVSLVRECIRGYKLPEPTRLAHKLVNEFRKTNQNHGRYTK